MGAVPSAEATTLYSYFRGTYEIGLIPLTKSFFGRPGEDEKINNNNNNNNMTTAEAAHRASTIELRRQFILMRSDPAIVYANARERVGATWPELLSNPFTEEDLDILLDIIENKYLYKSDAEMIADCESPLIPIPCALCLACKDGQERSGCFYWRGRSIVIIGYFGCIKSDLRRVFKVMKGNHHNNSNDNNINMLEFENHSHFNINSEIGKEILYLNAAVLASAGDRTLERVLVLAAVMLRNQYLNAAARVLSSIETNPFGAGVLLLDINDCKVENGESFSNSEHSNSEFMMNHQSYEFTPQAKEETLKILEQRLRHLTILVETAVDNYSSLKSLTENVAFLQCQTTVNPSLCYLQLPKMVFDGTGQNISSELTQSKLNNNNNNKGNNKDNNKDNNEKEPTTILVTSNLELTTSQAESISTVSTPAEKNKRDTNDTNINNISFNEGSPLDIIEPLKMSPQKEEKEKEEEETKPPKKEEKQAKKEVNESDILLLLDPNSPVEFVRLCFLPRYVTQAIMWASSLLTAPTRIAGGAWVQYKLKDESAELRHTLHGKDSLVASWRAGAGGGGGGGGVAGCYLGEHTGRLLRHVRGLQDEVERARGLPLQAWGHEELIQTREGRTCGLHYTRFGTMLVGIRGRRDGDDGRRQERKKNISSSRTGGGGGGGNNNNNSNDNNNDNLSSNRLRSRENRTRIGGNMETSTRVIQMKGLTLPLSAPTTTTNNNNNNNNNVLNATFDNISNISSGLPGNPMTSFIPGTMYGSPHTGFMPQYPFIPTSVSISHNNNNNSGGFIPNTPFMLPFYTNTRGDVSSVERNNMQQQLQLQQQQLQLQQQQQLQLQQQQQIQLTSSASSSLPTTQQYDISVPPPPPSYPSISGIFNTTTTNNNNSGSEQTQQISAANIIKIIPPVSSSVASESNNATNSLINTPSAAVSPFPNNIYNSPNGANTFINPQQLQLQQQQQQYMMIQQGPGNLPVLVPISNNNNNNNNNANTAAPQPPSYMSSYGYSYNTTNSPFIMAAAAGNNNNTNNNNWGVAPALPNTQMNSFSPFAVQQLQQQQSGNVAIAGASGFPGYVYYLPSQ